jgi:DNA-binding transcriptional LysR family regulator
VIRSFREMSPLVSLVLEESGSSELVQAVHDEEIDAAFIRSPVADVQGLLVRPILEEEMLVALPAAHALAEATTTLPLAELAKETFILYKRPGGPGLYDTIITACRGSGFSPLVGQEAPRIISTLNLVAAGLGVSIVPASLRRLQMDGVVYRRLADNGQLRAPLILVCRRGENSAAVQRFLELVQHSAEHVDADAP